MDAADTEDRSIDIGEACCASVGISLDRNGEGLAFARQEVVQRRGLTR
ncbi:MAG: hypothetical protein U0V56_11545 [Actinomycetota bacterium]